MYFVPYLALFVLTFATVATNRARESPKACARPRPRPRSTGTQLLQGQRFLRWRRAWRKNRSMRPLVAIVLKLEAIEYARRHQYGGGKPRKEIVQPTLAGAVPHGVAPRRGRQQGACSSTLSGRIGFKPGSWPPRLTNPVGHPADQRRCGCMDTTSGEKLGKSIPTTHRTIQTRVWSGTATPG